MKTNLLCLLALLLMIGCKKNDPEPEINCYPQFYSYQSSYGAIEDYRFDYDERMQLVVIEDVGRNYVKNRLYYNEDGTLKSSEELRHTGSVYRTMLYFYDSKKRLIKADHYNGEPSEIGLFEYYSFTYSPDNSSIRSERYSRLSPGEYYIYENRLFTYLSDKQIKLDFSYQIPSGGGSGAFEYLITLDDQKSSFWSVPAYRTMMTVSNFLLSLKNNVKSYKNLPEDKDQHLNYTNEFIFNSEGFPTTEYRTSGGGYNVRRPSKVTYICK